MQDDLRFADTRDIRVAYREHGPEDGQPVLLYHGFPDDALTWERLAQSLAADGYRTFAPYVRGFGPTSFGEGIERTGEIAALTMDVLAFADALGIERFHFVGHDWGARAGYGAAVLAPERLQTLTALAVAYGTNHAGQVMPVEQTRAYWYQWYFATERGASELERNRFDFCRALWDVWSPDWEFDDAEYAATAASFDNPDWVSVVLSSYRKRWGFEPGSGTYADIRARLEPQPQITVPTLVLMGRDDGATLPLNAEGKSDFFKGPYAVEILDDAGHFVHRERPKAVAKRVRAHLHAYENA
jgi:pimeloyl-ACP methyl ester carboxylesterase